MITANTRRNLQAFMETNVVFATTTLDKFEYLLSENARLRGEISTIKK